MCDLIAFIATLRFLFFWRLKLLPGYLCFPNTARQPQDSLRHNQNHMRSNTLQGLQPRDEVFFLRCLQYKYDLSLLRLHQMPYNDDSNNK